MPKSISVYVPDDLVEKMDKLPEVNWSEIARQSIDDYIGKRSRSEESKLQVIESTKVECSIEPGWISPKRRVYARFNVENKTGFDMIMDRILYSIRVAESHGAFSSGPEIAEIPGVYLRREMLMDGAKIACFAIPNPNLTAEAAEKILQLTTQDKEVEMKIVGDMYLESAKGVVKRWFASTFCARREFFFGEE